MRTDRPNALRRATRAARTLVAAGSILAGSILAPAAAGARARVHRAHRRAAPALAIFHSRRGVILTTGSGQTVYMFTRDARGRDICVHVAGCTSVWPPLIARGRVSLGRGVRRGLLATIGLPGHRRQLTYAGHALYLYTGNIGRGDIRYIGVRQFGGAWYALRPNGAIVR